jgi:hypothetical protein
MVWTEHSKKLPKKSNSHVSCWNTTTMTQNHSKCDSETVNTVNPQDFSSTSSTRSSSTERMDGFLLQELQALLRQDQARGHWRKDFEF